MTQLFFKHQILQSVKNKYLCYVKYYMEQASVAYTHDLGSFKLHMTPPKLVGFSHQAVIVVCVRIMEVSVKITKLQAVHAFVGRVSN